MYILRMNGADFLLGRMWPLSLFRLAILHAQENVLSAATTVGVHKNYRCSDDLNTAFCAKSYRVASLFMFQARWIMMQRKNHLSRPTTGRTHILRFVHSRRQIRRLSGNPSKQSFIPWHLRLLPRHEAESVLIVDLAALRRLPITPKMTSTAPHLVPDTDRANRIVTCTRTYTSEPYKLIFGVKWPFRPIPRDNACCVRRRFDETYRVGPMAHHRCCHWYNIGP
eukprot:scaffold25421_cov162-Amphora_coffeaeformis.AAC.3